MPNTVYIQICRYAPTSNSLHNGFYIIMIYNEWMLNIILMLGGDTVRGRSTFSSLFEWLKQHQQACYSWTNWVFHCLRLLLTLVTSSI